MAKGKKQAAGDGLIAVVDAAEFSKRLGFVNGALPRRNTIPILNCVLMRAEGAHVTLIATNLDQQAEVSVGGRIDGAGEICVDGARLMAVCGRMAGEMLLTEKEGKLTISAGSARAELPTLPACDFNALAGPEGAEPFEISSGVLASGMASVMHAASTEETRYYLNGIYVEPQGSTLVFTATDGHRMASLRISAGLPEGAAFAPFILPRGVLRDYIKFCERADGPVIMTVGETRLQLAARGEVYITKLIDGQFPDYEKVIPRAAGARISVGVAELKAAVSVAMTGTQEKTSSVRFETAEGRLACSCRQEAQFSEAVVEGVDIPACEVFGLSGKYVLDALDAFRGDVVEITVTEADKPVRFSTGDDLRQVIMPLRV